SLPPRRRPMSHRARVSRLAASFAALPLLVLLALPTPSRAQSQVAGGEIEGTVSSEGGVLPGVTVTVRNTATGLTRDTSTDGTGRYRAPLLPVGTYEVTATLESFAPAKRGGLELHIGETLEVDLTLQVTLSEELSVTAEAPVLEGSRTQQASTVSEQAVANLPTNGRNFI